MRSKYSTVAVSSPLVSDLDLLGASVSARGESALDPLAIRVDAIQILNCRSKLPVGVRLGLLKSLDVCIGCGDGRVKAGDLGVVRRMLRVGGVGQRVELQDGLGFRLDRQR